MGTGGMAGQSLVLQQQASNINNLCEGYTLRGQIHVHSFF
jgi:hypothetical protein